MSSFDSSAADDSSYHIELPPIDESEESEDSEEETVVHNPFSLGLTQGTSNAVHGLLEFAAKPTVQDAIPSVEVQEVLTRQCDPYIPQANVIA